MELTYYFPEEMKEEEKENLGKKALWFMEQNHLPKAVIKPERLLYDEEGRITGYCYTVSEHSTISLKQLFLPSMMERYHVDGTYLLLLAKSVLEILFELYSKGIYVGFVELQSIFTDPEKGEGLIEFRHPEQLQAGRMPSDYPWYPSDEMLFDRNVELFDPESQKVADAKLMYKILTASEKNNAKIPPNPRTQEYSSLFWNILSTEWKEFFMNLSNCDIQYEEMLRMLDDSLLQESDYKTLNEHIRKGNADEPEKDGQKKESAYAAIAVLREADKSAHDVSRELYLLQEKLAEHPRYDFLQAFILGDRHPFVRGFQRYGKEFKSQLAHVIHPYSYGEVLLVASEMLKKALETKEMPSVLFLILDGEIRKDAMFLESLTQMKHLSKTWGTKIVLLPVRDFKGEGFRMLLKLAGKKTD